MDAQWLASGFVRFVEDLTSASTQWSRFRRHVDLLRDSERFVAPEGAPIGRADAAARFLSLALSGPGRKTVWRRMTYLLKEPRRAGAVLAGWWLTKKAARQGRDLGLHFYFWVYAWTSVGLRYRGLRAEDLSLHSVAADFDVASLAEADDVRADVQVDRLSGARVKDALQARYTRQALARLAGSGNRDREGKSIE